MLDLHDISMEVPLLPIMSRHDMNIPSSYRDIIRMKTFRYLYKIIGTVIFR